MHAHAAAANVFFQRTPWKTWNNTDHHEYHSAPCTNMEHLEQYGIAWKLNKRYNMEQYGTPWNMDRAFTRYHRFRFGEYDLQFGEVEWVEGTD